MPDRKTSETKRAFESIRHDEQFRDKIFHVELQLDDVERRQYVAVKQEDLDRICVAMAEDKAEMLWLQDHSCSTPYRFVGIQPNLVVFISVAPYLK